MNFICRVLTSLPLYVRLSIPLFSYFFFHCCPFYVVYLQLEIYDRHRWHVVHLRINIGYIWACGEQRSARARAHIRSFVHAMEMPDDRRQHMDARCAAYSVYLFLTINCSNDIFVKYALQSKCINIYILCDLALCVLCLYITEKEINHISMFIRCMMPACLPPCSQKKQHCVRMGWMLPRCMRVV